MIQKVVNIERGECISCGMEIRDINAVNIAPKEEPQKLLCIECTVCVGLIAYKQFHHTLDFAIHYSRGDSVW